MRGNWETAEALVLAPGQQQQLQQQQQSIMEEQHLPLHSPTTPAWGGITDRIVKEEPVEDKNDDSGVSPGHYTSNSVSPRSRRSSSTANCSLSPGSATSQDSNVLHCGRFDYSPQSIYKSCDSPMAYGRLHAMDETSHTRAGEHQAMDDVSSSMKLVGEDSAIAQDNLQCPVCPFATFDRLQFGEHLAGHYAASCEQPQFTSSLPTDEHSQRYQRMDHGLSPTEEENRASPSQGERSEQESEEADEPGLRVPRVNSQGKVKTFRCKQCNFVAITKLEFWEHSRGHIKAEKLLTCPKCPFVTEYKHHLEYHLRNHFGSKPFKCDKCSYSCVNKSMLNSHLKSHSNVYQYRCANCSYATKYCHSLKLHLRKYKHNPAMVLNADGSPNPLPIIDVYGTRRGPKQKPSGESGKLGDESVDQTANGRARLSPVNPNHLGLTPMSAIRGLSNGPAVMSFPYGQLFPGFPITNQCHQLTEEATEKHLESLKTNILAEYAKIMANERMSVEDRNEESAGEIATTVSSDSPKIAEDASATTPRASPAIQAVTSEGNKSAPLDLSKPEAVATGATAKSGLIASDATLSSALSSVLSYDGKLGPRAEFLANDGNRSNANDNETRNSPRAAGTSRRKGRAVKLDRRVAKDEDDADNDATMESPDATATNDDTNVADSKETTGTGTFGGSVSNEFTCQYCEIAFGNVVMYTVHMGYHGYRDPYTCNMCGHECDDKLSFFLHIARSKHS